MLALPETMRPRVYRIPQRCDISLDPIACELLRALCDEPWEEINWLAFFDRLEEVDSGTYPLGPEGRPKPAREMIAQIAEQWRRAWDNPKLGNGSIALMRKDFANANRVAFGNFDPRQGDQMVHGGTDLYEFDGKQWVLLGQLPDGSEERDPLRGEQRLPGGNNRETGTSGQYCVVCKRSPDRPLRVMFHRAEDGWQAETPSCGHGQYLICGECLANGLQASCPQCGCQEVYT